ncbi:Serine/threonine protein kinase [Quadrisphaera granulorum]|uniref:non-specific serine/threonine protein kinase n=1 Tax=Quadrisphaera granulorum TaxID=317664 RepID=A0A315ZTF3_9ACTN|nr:BREX system serine/threonine kinase PglW [Quadrisphaera granulorum]PWJ48443.1 serine/threonine protein kinase [Quadrisphaera granulorum]SZE98402.1 Serine/threonine protein kinase [Quadrisphaera granulorum]
MLEQLPRWVEVSPSQFTHESEGLRRVRALLPDAAPYRAWSNFEFRDSHGKWHEVDLLVLGRRRLHLVELKYYSGTLRGDDHRWLRDGHRAEDSPLKLARRKAQRLASKLQDEFRRLAEGQRWQAPDVRSMVPFVQEAVFLHHPGFRSALPDDSAIDLFGLERHGRSSNLPDLSSRLLEAPRPGDNVITAERSNTIAVLMERIGAVPRRQREAGSWVIDEEPLGDGEGWQDWPAFHRVEQTRRGRVRFFVPLPGAPASEQQRVSRTARHEFSITSRLQHEGVLRPADLVDAELGVGLVYPVDDEFQRLDLWLSDQPTGVALPAQLRLLRRVAEAVAYAHGNRVVHRGLSPLVVSVHSSGERVLVGDWQSAGDVEAGARSSDGVTRWLDETTVRVAATRRLAATSLQEVGRRDVEGLRPEVFQAPEGRSRGAVDRVRLDVFALGALAYYLVSGREPARDVTALRERLSRDGGLDLAADLPQVSRALRHVVLHATHPVVGERTPDVASFLEELAHAERSVTETDSGADEVDPLDAAPGAVLDGRFTVVRRLGTGSTAAGLLVEHHEGPDAAAPPVRRVLKVALHDAAAARLADEAEVLRSLDHPRVVTLLEGPLQVGGRRALLLESAGERTLADELSRRGRLSLDRLEGWGSELLEVLVALDRKGVDHRDLKPANLGIREPRNRGPHLVLFDFSLSRAAATSLQAGTPPYLDPFLGTGGRDRFDSAAERYAAAVVLFEMATGSTPVYGDGRSDAGSTPGVDIPTFTAEAFDPAVAAGMVEFFRGALSRNTAQRHDTAADMLAAWRALFAPVPKTVPDDADARAEAAQPSTPLAEAGLSARALSAVEQLDVLTVGDLVAVDPVGLNRLRGVSEATRKEVKSRASAWRKRLLADVTAGGRPAPPAGAAGPSAGVTLQAACQLLLEALGGRGGSRRQAAALVLGAEGELDAFASQQELADALDVTRARAGQHLADFQNDWAGHAPSRALLDGVAGAVRDALAAAGGVATVSELTDAVLARFVPTASHGPPSVADRRVASGLLRLAVDRLAAFSKAQADDAAVATVVSRRHGGRIALLGTDAAFLDAADALGQATAQIVARSVAAGEVLVPEVRAARELREVAATALEPEAPLLGDAGRLVTLGVAVASLVGSGVGRSGSGDLHSLDLPTTTALALALAGAQGSERLPPTEVVARFRARFPALPPLPTSRAHLEALLREAGLDLVWDEAEHGFRARTQVGDTTGLASRAATVTGVPVVSAVGYGQVDRRLAESIAARSFLALGVAGQRVSEVLAAMKARTPADGGAVDVVDVTEVLLTCMREAAQRFGVPWDTVEAADAATPGSIDQQGLAALVTQALPGVEAAVQRAMDVGAEGSRAVLLTDVSPLARYGHLASLGRWSDLSARRRQAVWVLVPQLSIQRGPVIDRTPLPLAAPGQYLTVDDEWLRQRAAGTTGVTA